MKIFCLTTALLSGIFSCCFGQNTLGLPQIINYSKDDYQGGSQTWSIAQDPSGKMYFANNEGLISFDGNYWKIHPLPNKTIVRSLSIDSGNRIYVGGQDALGYFSPDEKGILQYTSLKNLIPKQWDRFADIWRIVIFKESVFFQATNRIFEYRNNAIKVFLPRDEWLFINESNGRLFAQDKEAGLMEFTNREWKPLRNNRLLKGATLSGIVDIDGERLLLSTVRNGFYIVSGDSISHSNIGNPIITDNQIYTSLKMNQSELVAGTISDGCLFMDFSGNMVQKISGTEGLQNNSVLCVFLDKDNNLWVGLNNGISFIAYNSAIKYIKPSKTNELAGYSSVIFNNRLYIGTSDGAFSAPLHQNNKDFSFSKSDFSEIKKTSGQVWKIEAVNQHLLLGHNDGIFTVAHNSTVPIAVGKGSWLFEPMSSVLPAKNILAGTYTGLRMIGFENDRFIDKGALSGLYESFRYMATGNDSTIWASHPYRGIYKLVLSEDNRSFTYRLFTSDDGLPSTLENYVFRIKNRIVFATSKGIYEFDPVKNTFFPSAFLTPVFKDMEVRYLKEDDDGDIWFCSGKKIGVVTFNKASPDKPFRITYFPELTGQILSGFENIYPYNKENIFISSERGVIHLNYSKYGTSRLKIKVLLGKVTAFGKADSLIFGGYSHHLSEADFVQTESEVYHLPGNYNSFHFEYSSPNYGLQKNVEYSHQLKGYDYKWSDWSSKTEKDYTNLPKGKYTFYIRAHDNLGHESNVIAYTFYVNPRWYDSRWAYILYFILFILLVIFLYQWQERNLNRQQVKFEKEQNRLKALHQLKLETSEKEIIKLQNEKLASEIKFKSKELANATMNLVERDSALIKVKDELQKLYKKTSNNHDIKKAILLLENVEQNNSNWEQFVAHFNEVNDGFLKKLKAQFPKLSNTDIKVCTYLKLNLSSKEIAQLMNISVRGVEISRYRLRKKLDIPRGQSLNAFLNDLT